MRADEVLLDVAVGLAAGVVATKVTEYAQMALWRLTPEDIKRREERVRPGPPYRVAARKTTEALGADLDPDQLSRAGMAFHYGSGVAWGAIYCLMRRASGMRSLGAGVATGTSMPVILDEVVTPALGFSAPDRAYPTATHVRGFAGHLLVYGLALAASAEALYRLVEHAGGAPERREEQHG